MVCVQVTDGELWAMDMIDHEVVQAVVGLALAAGCHNVAVDFDQKDQRFHVVVRRGPCAGATEYFAQMLSLAAAIEETSVDGAIRGFHEEAPGFSEACQRLAPAVARHGRRPAPPVAAAG
ncbi:hypothetical protein [Actinoplanes sp. G11-F43]|uniref:hypothetical protein n=1 Tax=Actinoplanes sp. G11-F43 TaxID=3424130 RepID=UPI003D354048